MIHLETWRSHPLTGAAHPIPKSAAPYLSWPLMLWLVGGATLIEFMAPLLIDKLHLPGALRYTSDLVLAGITALTIMQMLVTDRIPRLLLLLTAVTVIGATVATFEGQSGAATLWGWWSLFKYPITALFLYLQPHWPPRLAAWLVKGYFALLVVEVMLQLGQFATGEVPGDHLAGTFGRYGVGPLLYVVCLILCLAVAHWVVWDDWKILAGMLGLGFVASVLGEMKVFPVLTVVIGILGLLLYLANGGRLYKALLALLLLGGMLGLFSVYYNAEVSAVRGTRRLEDYFQLTTLIGYLNFVGYDSETGTYYLGRGFAMQYGWQLLQRDTTTLLFGYGLGARSESVSLGIVGEGLRQGYYGLFAGTSLLVLMQELGVVGLAAFGSFLLWLTYTLLRYSASSADPNIRILCYGFVLYSTLWPVWLWYHTIWSFGAPMLLYWAPLGYLVRGAIDAQNTPPTTATYQPRREVSCEDSHV